MSTSTSPTAEPTGPTPAAGPRMTDRDPSALVRGNERLTAWLGAMLLVLLAAEGATLLDVHWFLRWHMVIGLALFVPVAFKLASTIFRFARYYTGDPAFRADGPPRLLLRVLGPIVALSTLAVLLTGAVIMLTDTYRHQLEELHKASFLLWFAVMTVHVLAYVWRVPGLMLADLRERTPLAWRRIGVLAAVNVLTLAASALAWVAVQAWMSR